MVNQNSSDTTLAFPADLEAMAAERASREFVMSRVFAAPRALVFKAFTEPERLMQWFGPREWPLSFCEVDLRVGGCWRYCMTGPGGEQAWGKGVYTEIAAPGLLAYTDYFTDAEGITLPGMPSAPSRIEFAEVHGGTRVTARSLYATEADLQKVLAMGMEQGLAETWDLLAEHLARA